MLFNFAKGTVISVRSGRENLVWLLICLDGMGITLNYASKDSSSNKSSTLRIFLHCLCLLWEKTLETAFIVENSVWYQTTDKCSMVSPIQHTIHTTGAMLLGIYQIWQRKALEPVWIQWGCGQPCPFSWESGRIGNRFERGAEHPTLKYFRTLGHPCVNFLPGSRKLGFQESQVKNTMSYENGVGAPGSEFWNLMTCSTSFVFAIRRREFRSLQCLEKGHGSTLRAPRFTALGDGFAGTTKSTWLSAPQPQPSAHWYTKSQRALFLAPRVF